MARICYERQRFERRLFGSASAACAMLLRVCYARTTRMMARRALSATLRAMRCRLCRDSAYAPARAMPMLIFHYTA